MKKMSLKSFAKDVASMNKFLEKFKDKHGGEYLSIESMRLIDALDLELHQTVLKLRFDV